ncbi:G-protein coupled receptor GRL101-like [Lineus longissimus]|uniref:G-protein coupled receptor GRL101-like n=1 Tax=Lineus longissimus TaxID=88925 RepID=UPI00315D6798
MGVYLYIIAAADTTFRGYYIEVDWTWREGIGCKIAGFLSVLSSEVSVFTLTVMSVNRFLVVVFPFSKQKINFKKAKILVASIWIFGVILAGAPFCVDYLRHSYYSRSGVCLSLHQTSEPAPGWEYSVAIFLGLNLVAFMIIAVLYTWMYVIIKCSVDMMKHKTSRKKGENKELVVALNVLTDFACWMPIIILGLAAISGKVTIPGDVYAWIAVFVLPINSAMNPILYTLSSLDLINKKALKIDEDDEDGSPKVVNCYPEGSHLLPYVVEESNMLNLAHAIKTETPSLPLRDMRSVLTDVAKAKASLHVVGYTN